MSPQRRRHPSTHLRAKLETLFTAPFNVTGDRGVVLPCGYSEGLPVGLQLAAAFGADQELLQTAAAVEATLNFVNKPRCP
jgi:aspartyl-tRNA(Asn)/glutamyl-tRNA(Gln) amidotransferase subunit A